MCSSDLLTLDVFIIDILWNSVVDVEESNSIVRNNSTDFLIYYLGGEGLPLAPTAYGVFRYPFS